MKIDNAIKEFLEKYDREAISSINRISADYALNISRTPIKVFSIQEGFDNFQAYLRGYSSYKINNHDNEKASPQSAIKEGVNRFLNSQLFVEQDITYDMLGQFIESYVNGIKSLTETVDTVKRDMMESGVVSQEDIGDVNEFVDSFIDKLNESFDPAMDRILWASGYNSNKAIFDREKKERPVFL